MSEALKSFKIHCFSGGMMQTNGYLLEAPGGSILIDAPEGVCSWLTGEGHEPALLLLTHQHFDHVLGAAEVANLFGCPIWAHSAPSAELTLEDFFGGLGGTGFEIAPFGVDRLLEGQEGGAFDACGHSMEVLHVPGHSPDSVCFVAKEIGVVFGGDVLFNRGTGRTDFPGGSSEQLREGIKTKLYPLPDTFQVLPGHGPPTTIGEEKAGNPLVRGE